MAIEGLKKLSLSELVSRLHDSISNFAKNIERLTQKNRELTLVDIIELRNHVKQRLEAHENTVENEKLAKLIELFKEDKNALELAKIDLEEWVDFLDAIKEHVEQRAGSLGAAEKKELQDINKLKADIEKLQGVLRKAD